jgi:transglutaminase-like putative cysteine protease
LGFGISALAVFLFLPRFASRPIVPPFSINLPIRGGVTSQVINPGAPLIQVNGIREPDKEGDYYYGFDSQLDLRYRGGLSDIVVMYVRSPAWSYWRSHSYDFYNGYAWSQSDATLTPATRWNRFTFEIPADTQAPGPHGGEIAQTFYIVHDQPNLVFAAYRPSAIALNSESLVMDSGDSLRAGGPLVEGTTYTVLSHRPDFSTEQLRAASGGYPPEITARYLQLPTNISPRVRDRARQLTADAPTAYDKASAIRDDLLKIPYDFFPPPQPPGSETVDNFLFVDRRGVCEQFATAMTVMLRAQGIPARLVAGYGAGEYNALSGYYTVRASDAHAWVEVYFPGYGWVPFDPTPGVEWRANPYTEPVRTWFLSGAFEGVSLPLGEMFSAGAALFSAALAPLGVLAIPLALACFVLLLTFLFRRLRRRSQPVRFAAIDRDPHRQRILATYRAAQSKLKLRRAPAETPRELAQRLSNPDWDELTLAVEQAAYRVTPPSPSLARRVREVVARLRPSPPTPLPK